MSIVTINDSLLGGNLSAILNATDIEPGSNVNYELCKQLWINHPLGGKLVEKPIRMALNKPRGISIDCYPKELLLEAFQKEWDSLNATEHIRDVMFITRAYGAGAIIMGAKDMPTDIAMDYWKLAEYEELYFNHLDPLNTAGSIVTNQNPNAPDFQKPMKFVTAAGQPYHPSRSVVMFNGPPIYIFFEPSAFGFTGRSVFQRVLYPMKSFIQSMITDDLVTRKAGFIIAKQKQSGSIINSLMERIAGIKRTYIQQGMTGNVLTIDTEEDIEAIDLTNTDTAMTTARDNIIANIAAGAEVPALIIKDEAFTKGFGEGTEDTKAIVQFIDGIRTEMSTLFRFFTRIVQHRAWNQQFFEALQNKYPDMYKGKDYRAAFYEWQNSFKAIWPNLMEETQAEKAKTDDIKIKGIADIAQTLLPICDPVNRARLVAWMADNINEIEGTFKSSLQLDYDLLENFEPPITALSEPKVPKPASSD